MEHPDKRRAMLTYEFPLAEMITGYYDKLKSVSRGYASMDYDLPVTKPAIWSKWISWSRKIRWTPFLLSPSVKAPSTKSRGLIHKLRKLIPRQNFEIPLQAAIGGKIIAREDIVALRKDVLAKCYGGDITRKRKLLEKQTEGKKKMKMVGSVEVPQEAFLLLLKMEE